MVTGMEMEIKMGMGMVSSTIDEYNINDEEERDEKEGNPNALAVNDGRVEIILPIVGGRNLKTNTHKIYERWQLL